MELQPQESPLNTAEAMDQQQQTQQVEDLMTKSLQHYHRHRYKEAKVALEESLATARTINPLPHLLVARALGNLANTSKELHDHVHAVELYEEALTMFAHVGDKKREGIILFNAAYTYKTLRRWKSS